MKTPDEIKKGLETRIPVHFHRDGEPRLTPKQYVELECLHAAALSRIQWLETEYDKVFRLCGDLHHDMLEQRERADKMEAERNAAILDMTKIVQEYGEPCCEYCGADYKPNCTGKCWTHNEGFRWRGVRKEE